MTEGFKEYRVSWWRQYSQPVRLSWWRRWLGQQRTQSIWINHHCVVTLTDAQVEAFGGWQVLSAALVVPLIHAAAGNYTNLAMPTEPAITSMPAIVGLQVEDVVQRSPYIETARTNLLPNSEDPRFTRDIADLDNEEE